MTPKYLAEPQGTDMDLLVNQIIPFSNVDGDGNRCSIFLQECNISCHYCHNSETIGLCCNCGVCVDECPTDALSKTYDVVTYVKAHCIHCDRCIAVCPHSSTPKAVRYDTDELVGLIGQYKPYIRGITVSGGEPTLQHEGIAELFVQLEGTGLTRYVDTNGFVDLKKLDRLLSSTDGFLLDLKADENQEKLCGASSEHVFDNLTFLARENKLIEVRTVIFSGYVDVRNVIMKAAVVLRQHPEIPYRLIRGHLTGLKPQKKSLLEAALPTNEQMNRYRLFAYEAGITNVQLTL